jgi:hypothetical protein
MDYKQAGLRLKVRLKQSAQFNVITNQGWVQSKTGSILWPCRPAPAKKQERDSSSQQWRALAPCRHARVSCFAGHGHHNGPFGLFKTALRDALALLSTFEINP